MGEPLKLYPSYIKIIYEGKDKKKGCISNYSKQLNTHVKKQGEIVSLTLPGM